MRDLGQAMVLVSGGVFTLAEIKLRYVWALGRAPRQRPLNLIVEAEPVDEMAARVDQLDLK
jgi:hypothetical protein